MSKLKEYYLNNLTEEEIDELSEYLYLSEQYEMNTKDLLTSQLEGDKDKRQTYPYDS